MAAASRTAQYNAITAAPDVMDLHSDGGFGFGNGDGDIDLDLQPTDDHNDDLSIYDAASDNGLEAQTVAADQDDFMVDDEDVIQEDTLGYSNDDVDVADVDQPADDAVDGPENDDDLIDYSEDEEEPVWTGHEVAPAAAGEGADEFVKDEDPNPSRRENPAEATGSSADVHADNQESTASPIRETAQDGSHADDDQVQNLNEQVEESLAAYENPVSYLEPAEEAKATEEDDGTYVPVDSPNIAQDDAALTEKTGQTKHETQLPPVTVNYDGAELWLFKLHDYEDSGDYLVEDETLADKPLSHVLEACREPLGSDVTDDVELGFRLDNFHNIEVFQEHTACAFVTLASLLDLYQQLHAQDGISNPESFYMTLLFRPRVSSLLNELRKAAAEGLGHSGLERAIAAGLTAFNAQPSHNSTEHVAEDWANGEEGEEHDDHKEGPEQAEEVDDGENHDGQGQEQDNDDPVEQLVQGTGPDPATPATSVHKTTPIAKNRSLANDVVEGPQPLVSKSESSSAHASPTSHNDDDDIIDYSDDEAEEEVAHTDVARATPPSSASSTVQGDVSNAQDHVEALADHESAHTVDDEAFNGQTVGDFTDSAAYHEEQDALYEGFDEAYGEDYVEENKALEVEIAGGVSNEYPEDYPAQKDGETTNQYDIEHETGATHVDLSRNPHEEHSNDDPAPSTFLDNLRGEDEFLDFHATDGNVDLWPDEQPGTYGEDDEIAYDDEDGAAGQALVAASAAAKPADTLSSELLELSPQGQKRTIDEVAIDVDDVTDTSGMPPCRRRKLHNDTDEPSRCEATPSKDSRCPRHH